MNWTAFIVFTGGIFSCVTIFGLIFEELESRKWLIAFVLSIIYLGIGIGLLKG